MDPIQSAEMYVSAELGIQNAKAVASIVRPGESLVLIREPEGEFAMLLVWDGETWHTTEDSLDAADFYRNLN